MFTRKFSQAAIESLKKEQLFTDHLFPDITEGNKKTEKQKQCSVVFPAVRNDKIDFYWGGGNLFSYNQSSGFSTNHKYASVLLGNSGNYVSESALKNREVRLIENFCDGYERIKENCERYSGPEALGVSSLYKRFSCARKEASSVVILDIEASFARDESQEKDRIDIVLFDTKSKMIRFVEAKHYSNNASLRVSEGDPAVVDQIQGYRDQLQGKEKAILDAYRNHVQVINALFSVNIPEPRIIDPEPVLLIFGFDTEQRDYYLKKNIEKFLHDKKGLRVYSKGNIKYADLASVFKGGRANW